MRILVQNPSAAHHSRSLPAWSLSTVRKLWDLPLLQAGWFLGILACCRTRDRLTSGRTLICPHFPAAGSDLPALLSSLCLLAQAGETFPPALGAWSFDLQMPEEPGQHLRQDGLAGSSLLDHTDPIRLHDGESSLCFGPKHKRSEGCCFEAEEMSSCLSAWEAGEPSFAVHLDLPQLSRKHLIKLSACFSRGLLLLTLGWLCQRLSLSPGCGSLQSCS